MSSWLIIRPLIGFVLKEAPLLKSGCWARLNPFVFTWKFLSIERLDDIGMLIDIEMCDSDIVATWKLLSKCPFVLFVEH